MRTAVEAGDDGPSIFTLLAQRARRTADGRLVIDAGVGLIVAIAAALWHFHGWHLALLAATCVAAYGSWGICDRILGEHAAAGLPPARQDAVLRAVRGAAAAAGTLSGIAFLLAGFAAALGTWIS